MNEIWLIRHGVTRANRLGVIQGQSAEPLSDEGRDQARALGRWLAEHRVAFDALVASPLSRAAETASIIAAALGVDDGAIEPEPRLAERSFGDREGQPAVEVFGEQLRAAEPGTWRPPNGESLADLSVRVLHALAEIAARSGERVAVICHGGPIRAAVCAALELPFVPASLARLRCDNTSVSVLEPGVGPGRDAYLARTINARFHL